VAGAPSRYAAHSKGFLSTLSLAPLPSYLVIVLEDTDARIERYARKELGGHRPLLLTFIHVS
jgi:hypothetical protein